MLYRPLGTSPLHVSALALGSMTWGEQNTEVQGFEQILARIKIAMAAALDNKCADGIFPRFAAHIFGVRFIAQGIFVLDQTAAAAGLNIIDLKFCPAKAGLAQIAKKRTAEHQYPAVASAMALA